MPGLPDCHVCQFAACDVVCVALRTNNPRLCRECDPADPLYHPLMAVSVRSMSTGQPIPAPPPETATERRARKPRIPLGEKPPERKH